MILYSKLITEKNPHNMYLYNRLGLGHTKKCLGSQANFVKKKMDEGGMVFFSPEIVFLFSKNFIKSTTAAIVTLSRMICFIFFQSKNLYSILFYVQVEDLKVFIKV